jgi:hypothetical protein
MTCIRKDSEIKLRVLGQRTELCLLKHRADSICCGITPIALRSSAAVSYSTTVATADALSSNSSANTQQQQYISSVSYI